MLPHHPADRCPYRTDNSEMLFDETDWLAYNEANGKFAEAVNDVARSGDLVWVQDYHRTP